jgi:abortive infection bacteriophage resistance protein
VRNFTNQHEHAKWYSKLLAKTEEARERFLDHFKAKYDGFPEIPLWMASEIMSLGSLSVMYQWLRPDL